MVSEGFERTDQQQLVSSGVHSHALPVVRTVPASCISRAAVEAADALTLDGGRRFRSWFKFAGWESGISVECFASLLVFLVGQLSAGVGEPELFEGLV